MPPHWLFPLDSSASLTVRVFGSAILVGVMSLLVTWRRAGWRRASLGVVGASAAMWLLLLSSRPPWQRAALASTSAPTMIEGAAFVAVGPGVEVATHRIVADGVELETVELIRLDPALHSFAVRVDAERPRVIGAWRETLSAVAVVNGSYFLPDRTPQTPLRAGGRPLGPTDYVSTHGAFVADPARGTAAIVDLRGVALPHGLSPFPEAMVSYPLLLSDDGGTRAAGRADWLASRTFVGVDGKGWVVLGTTRHGYFSLRRLADYLRKAPLGLVTALNLDGGPIAAQALHTRDLDRLVIGDAETNAGADVLRARIQAARRPGVPLPIVLAALPR